MKGIEALKKRLYYESQHRGMRELDLLLGKFSKKFLPLMGEQELKEFEALLTFSDDDLYGWFFEKTEIPEKAPRSLINVIINQQLEIR